MKPPQSPLHSSVSGSAEDTLKLIANLPAPEGLAERVQAGLRAAPRTSRVLAWPTAPAGGWMHATMLRGAAAAAIVCVVAGGGWQIFSRIQVVPGSAVNQNSPSIGVPRGFSSADAKRVPSTITGPVLTHAIVPTPVENSPAQTRKPALPKLKAHKRPTAPAAAPMK